MTDHAPAAASPHPLAQMLRRVLLDIRLLGRRGHALQAADLADACHNLPVLMFTGQLDLARLRRDLAAYQQKYGAEGPSSDYVAMLDDYTATLGKCGGDAPMPMNDLREDT